MAKDIRVRLYSNSKEFNSEMNALAKQMRIVKSEFEATRTSVGVWGDALKQSEAKIQYLTKQIELQKQKVDQLKKAYEDAATKKGQDAAETLNLATRLNRATAELNKMQNELTQTNQKLNEFRENQSINQFENDIKSLSLAMQKVDAEFKVASSAAENFGNDLKQAVLQVQSLNQKIELQQQVVNRLEEEYKRVAQAKGQDANETKQLAIRLDEAKAELNGLQNELTQTIQKLNQMEREVAKQSTVWGKFTSNMDTIGNKMQHIGGSVAITASAGFATMSFAMKNAVETGMEFGKQVSRVGAISDATAEQIQQLKDQALDLGAKTTKSATEVAQAQEQLAASGFKVNEIIAAMPGVIAAAEASGEDMATVSEIMAAAIRGFGLEASKSAHIADVFAMAANRSNASILDMGYSFKYAAPIAKQLGMSVEELAAATAVMRDRGMAAEQIGTSLRMGLTRLIAPTDEAAGVMKQLGINIKDAQGNMLPLDQTIKVLRDSTKNLTQEQKMNAFQTIFGTEAMTGFLNLVDAGPQQIAELTQALRESDGASQKAASAMKDNLAGAVENMNGALETAKIKLTDALTPALEGAANSVTRLLEKWNSLDSDTQQIIAKTGALSVAIMGVVGVVGTLTAAVGALMAFSGPIGLAIVGVTAALGALGLGLFAAHEKTEQLRKKQEESERQAIRYGEGLSAGTKKAVQGYTDLYEGAKLKMIELQTMSGEKARATSKEVVDAFSKMADQVIAALQTQKEKLVNAINDVYGIAGDAGKKKAKDMTDEIIKSFDKDIAAYKKALDTLKEAHEKYNNDLSKMPAEFAAKYQEALKVMEGGAREFAQSQNELQAIQKSIIDKQGKILFDEAEGYVKRINETYKKSVEAANKWYSEKQKVFEQALAQGRISQQQYDQLMLGVESRTNEMLAKAAQEREQALASLASHLDQRGKLIDIATGKIFERQKKFLTDMNGFIVQVEESDKEYIERWKAHTEEVLKKTADFSQKTKAQYQKDLQAFLEAMGVQKEQAQKTASEIVNKTLAEMKKGNKEAEKAGKDKGDSHKKGIESTVADNKKTGEKVSKNTDEGLSQNKADAQKHGKDKGDNHKKGVESTAGANKVAGANVSKSTDEGLAQGKGDAQKHGADKGTKHGQGLKSTEGSNRSIASTLSSLVSNILGSTTDGGGGKKAGSTFASGLSSQKGNAQSAGSSVSSAAEKGLKSHDGKEAGQGFVSGFIRSILAGSGSVWSVAWNLGKTALSALKKAIDSHSPSKETEKEGKNFTEGFAIGITKNTNTATSAAKKMADATIQELMQTTRQMSDVLVPDYRKAIQISDWQRKEMTKIAKLGAAERVQAVEQWISKQRELENILAKDEVAIWQYVLENFKLNAEDRKRVSLNLRDAKRKVDQEIFENEKKYIEERKKFNQLSLMEELRMWEEVASRWAEGSQKRAEAEENIYRLRKQIYDELKQANDDYYNKVKEANEKLYQEELKAKEDYEQKVKQINDRLIEDERRLTEEYQKAVEDRTKSLYSFAGLFDEFKRKNDVTGQGLLKNLSDQISAFRDWQSNIASLAARGIDEGLLQELRDMGPRAVDEIAALNSLSDEELQQYVQLWREKNALAKSQAVNELEGMRQQTQMKIQQLRLTASIELEQVKTEYNNKIAELRAQTNAQLEQHKNEWITKIKEISEGTKNELNLMTASMADIGKNTVQGLIDGLNSMIGPLQKKAQEIAAIVESTMKTTLKIKSPSQRMRDEVGRWIPAGIIEGMEQNIGIVISTAKQLALAAMPDFSSVSDELAERINKMAFTISSAANEIRMNSDVLVVKNQIESPNLENKLDRLLLLLEKSLLSKNAQSPTINQYLTFNSPKELSPSETARKHRQVSRQLAMEMGW
ncbi:phage tail tape measure protein [Parageobacillus thermoglucosidasius]|uniref:phage tail tape measure protein n=1 Tax=Parageobacillus thermoglucosidasius TaxID=1426 RepID=UPI000B56FB23|nr:phage tail tape measure protein [Parageobacillus thermoglucosidasius]OUM84948.1 MAG: phage tail tape measure protein [Parageobacillus thermoglucosidasius]